MTFAEVTIHLVPQERFELPTSDLEGRHSIQLSYWGKSQSVLDDTQRFRNCFILPVVGIEPTSFVKIKTVSYIRLRTLMVSTRSS